MKDLNFFEIYLEKEEFSIDNKLIIFSLSIILILALIIYTIPTQVKIRSLSKDISKLQSTVEDERVNKKIHEIKEKEVEIREFNESLEKLKAFDNIVDEGSIIDSHLLDNIVSKMPEDVFFTSINIYTNEIQISGNAKNKWAIAQLGKNLESIDDFYKIFISNISSEEDYYNFVLNISLEDVNIDNGESNDEKVEEQEETNEESDQ